jgi:hypothetical protein
MLAVPDQSYLSVWCTDFPEELMLERLGAFLGTVPFSAARPGFTHLTVRAIDPSETPLLEQDFRSAPLDAPAIIELLREHLHGDCAADIRAYRDLSLLDDATAKWKKEPQPVDISCFGEDYDAAVWRESGHFLVNLGFEHYFTGHPGLLGVQQIRRPVAETPEEARLLEVMAWPENLERYQKETRENIRGLLDWVNRIETEMPVRRVQLWSEGDGDFEARMEEILAAR